MDKYNIPKEKFAFVNAGQKISDKKFDDKPIGYFKDAWIRFRKSKASVVAAIIIICIVLYSFLTPLFITTHDATFMCGNYAKKPARVTWLRELGIATGGVKTNQSEAGYIKLNAIAVGAESVDGKVVSFAEVKDGAYHPVLKTDTPYQQEQPNKKLATYFPTTVDTYLEVGFLYVDVAQTEYQKILAWQEESGLQVLYPLIDTQNGYCFDSEDANYWYKAKTKGAMPVHINDKGKAKEQAFSEDLILEDNY